MRKIQPMKIQVAVIEHGKVILSYETDTDKYKLFCEELGNEIAGKLYKDYYGNLYRIGHKQPYRLALSYDPFGLLHYDVPNIGIYIADEDNKLVSL